MEQQGGSDFAPVYRRQLPGGGYVAIDVQRHCPDTEVPKSRVCVERRIVERTIPAARDPIVIAEADGDEHSPGFIELYRIAADNAAIARALLRMGAADRAD